MSERAEVATKPNCYLCVHRRKIPGDAHSRCAHPGARDKSVVVAGDEHGIRMGWFMWPLNFDPIWLESCSGFEPKDRTP